MKSFLLSFLTLMIPSIVISFNLNIASKPNAFTYNSAQNIKSHQRILLTYLESSANNDLISNSNKQYDTNFFSKAIPSVLLSICILSTVSIPASFAATAGINSMNYQGDYADPFHPYCERHIDVASTGKTFHYSGTAVGPKGDTVLRGCSEEEQKLYGSRNGAFDGSIIEAGAKITAGDGIHEGLWEPAFSNKKGMKYGDVDGIRWDDGNKWVKLASPSDVLTFPDTYKEKSKVDIFNEGGKWFFVAYVVISLAAGAKEFSGRFQRWVADK